MSAVIVLHPFSWFGNQGKQYSSSLPYKTVSKYGRIPSNRMKNNAMEVNLSAKVERLTYGGNLLTDIIVMHSHCIKV